MGKNKDKNRDKSEYFSKSESKHEKLGLLDVQTMGYYRRISETLKGNFDSEVEKELFINNVFIQLTKEVLQVSRNQAVSRIVEELIPLGGQEQIISLLGALSGDWEISCCDRFASYVTQSVLLQCNQYLACKTDDDTLSNLIDGLYTFLMSQLAFYMQHTYASHVIRVLLEVLAGVKVSDEIVRSKLSRGAKNKVAAKEEVKLKLPLQRYRDKLAVMCETMVKLNKLSDHVQNGLSSPVLQTVLLVSRTLGTENHSAVCQILIQNGDVFKTVPGEELSANVTHEVASHFIELLLTVVPSDWLDKILSEYFIGRLLLLAKHPMANFVLQKLLTSLQTSEQFETVFSELAPHLESILALNHIGVIVKMSDACIRLHTKQKKFLKALQKAFHCYKPAERQCKLFSLIASLTAYEVFYNIKEKTEEEDGDTSAKDDDDDDDDKKSDDDDDDNDDDGDIKVPTLSSINYHGSLILQSLMKFSNPKPVVTGLMELKPAEMRTLYMDCSGSFIVEAFINSETVGDKSRETFCNKLKGHLVDLACDKFGSRVFDAVWKHSALKQRCVIAEELLRQEQKVRANKFGFYVHSRCGLQNFRSRPQEWKDYQTGQIKKRKQFEEVLQDEGAPPTKKSEKSKR